MCASLRADGLALDRVRAEDFGWIHELFSGSGHTIGHGPLADEDETREWLTGRDQRFEELGLVWYAIRAADGVPVGTCGAFVGTRCGADPEIGYEVHPSYRGKGYAKTAAAATTRAIHEAGHTRVWATIRPANAASIHIVEALDYHLITTGTGTSEGELLYYMHEGQ